MMAHSSFFSNIKLKLVLIFKQKSLLSAIFSAGIAEKASY